jgi:hypothetical protein
MKYFFIIFSFFALTRSLAQSVNASQGWTVSIASSITEAGSDYATTTSTSAANQTLLDLNLTKNTPYTVMVHKIDTDWNNGLTLSSRRTGAGTSGSGGGTISGGLSYIALTGSPQVFFTGVAGNSGRANNIPIQYQISGISVTIPVKTHITTVVYTISN